MSTKHINDSKEKILISAISLFAKRGFSAVGVREIASEAGVNISMISYYFNGKAGILKAIIDEYYDDLEEIAVELHKKGLTKEETFRQMIYDFVRLIRNKTELCRVAILEMPFEMPEYASYKFELLKKHIEIIKKSFHKSSQLINDPTLHAIIGPAFISLVYSNFLLGNVAGTKESIEFNDEFYHKYAETIATLFLEGIRGLSAKLQPTENIETKSKNDNLTININ